MSSRDPLLIEVASLRDQLAVANATIEALKSSLDEQISPFYGVANLTKRESEIVAAIVCHGRITHERLSAILYRHAKKSVEPGTIAVQMTSIRKKLAAHSVTIRTLWNVGYEMANEDRAKMRALVGVLQ